MKQVCFSKRLVGKLVRFSNETKNLAIVRVKEVDLKTRQIISTGGRFYDIDKDTIIQLLETGEGRKK